MSSSLRFMPPHYVTVCLSTVCLWTERDATPKLFRMQQVLLAFSSLGTLVGGGFGQRFLLRVIRWDGCACDRGLFSQPYFPGPQTPGRPTALDVEKFTG